ncbi:hypothetical protein J132_03386 [Termitomyces sp. J132]|nr:hypothetical protein J132_03386 [Termitomyces sp. J132]
MSSDDGLEYVDPAQQRPAEDLDPALPNDPPQPENPAENIPAEEPEPPLGLPIPPQLGPIQPVPRGRQPYLIEYPPHYLGPMTVICPHCQALHFDAEKLTKSTRNSPKFGMCCLQGQVNLPRLRDAPADLLNLLHGHHPLSNTFKTSIRQYNAAFAFTSLGVKIDHAITNAPGPYSFRINGELHHLTGALLPIEGNLPVYAQLYFYDHNQQLAFRQQNNPRLDPQIMASLQDMLARVNPFIGLYKQARQIMGEVPEGQPQRLSVKLTADFGDPRRYNDPNEQEGVAAVIPGDGSEERSNDCDIVLHLHGGQLKQISHLHPYYTPLHYTIIFPTGQPGFHTNIRSHFGPQNQQRSAKVTQTAYYAYRLQQRTLEFNAPLLWSGRLFQQYVVDAWASTEQNKLNWIRHNQKKIRAEVYQGVVDAAAGDEQVTPQSRRVILPSSHTGSDRQMQQLFQDSMAICRNFGKPDLFLTMTANPKWSEIEEALLKEPAVNGKKQTAADRPDIVARVFELKKNAVVKEIKEGLFGSCVAYVHTIEFQKRGLPHMHILIFFHRHHRIKDAPDVDSIVSAQIPDPVTQPQLYQVLALFES